MLSHLSLSLLSSLLLVQTTFASSNLTCKESVALTDSGVLAAKIIEQSALKGLVYPQSLPKNKGNHLMFGFESEFTMSQLTVLLSIYRPRAEFGIDKKTWISFSEQQRLEWVKTRAASMSAGDKDIGLELDRSLKLPNGSSIPSYLTEKLIIDETGNLEIVQDPVDTYAEFVTQSKWITANLGAGSMQGTVTSPKESFFNQNKEDLIGFFTFFGQSDPLQKLSLGADRFKQDQTKLTAKSFNHPFLGPLTRLKQAFLAQYIRFNSKGEFFTPESKEFIAGRDDSFKYTGMVSYRPDIGGRLRVGTEVRDAHNDVALLNSKVAKAAHFHKSGMSAFADFGKIQSFDTVKTFDSMPLELQELLKELFPLKLKAGYTYIKSEIVAREVFRNFAFPMQDWSPWLKALKQPELTGRVKIAQKKYLARLTEVKNGLISGKISKEAGAAQAQGALGLFAQESGLTDAFENFVMTQIK